MVEENGIRLVDWKVKLDRDAATGAAVLRVWGRGPGIAVTTAPILTADAVQGGWAAVAEDGAAYLLSTRDSAWPRLYGPAKAEWSCLVRELDSFELKCFACIWREAPYTGGVDEEDRPECMGWAVKNGLEPEAWRRIRDMALTVSGTCGSRPPAEGEPAGHGALYINLSAFCANYIAGYSEGSRRDGYLEWGYSSRRMESGKKPLMTVRMKWKDWTSPKEVVFFLRCRITAPQSLEILEAKLSPAVEPQWLNHIAGSRPGRPEFRFRRWEHIFLRNVGDAPLILNGEPLNPGEIRELEVEFTAPRAAGGQQERRAL